MGYKDSLWQRVRLDFPVTKHLVYVNHAAVAPLPAPVAAAHISLAEDARDWGSFHYDKWLQVYEKTRIVSARLVGGHRDEIAIVKNTSEGIATVALGVDWKAGDRVVAFRQEFPANYYPWLRLESRGVELRWLDIDAPLDQIDRACEGARLLAISHVNYLTGYRVDLDAIGEICRRRDVFFFVDAIQGLGAFPIDVRRSHIDALAADGHKWLLGPEGCGVLYIRRERLDEIEPVEFGWTNVAAYADYASRDMTLRKDAGRYECGTLNTIGIFGLEAAIRYLLEIGIDQISPAVEALAARLSEGVQAKGYRLAAGTEPGTTSGIVSFQKDGVDSRAIVATLRDHGIVTAPRQGWVRASPHFYIAPEEIDRMVALLP
jgi:cysteine desulfurase / selenocysteine lyase